MIPIAQQKYNLYNQIPTMEIHNHIEGHRENISEHKKQNNKNPTLNL